MKRSKKLLHMLGGMKQPVLLKQEPFVLLQEEAAAPTFWVQNWSVTAAFKYETAAD